MPKPSKAIQEKCDYCHKIAIINDSDMTLCMDCATGMLLDKLNGLEQIALSAQSLMTYIDNNAGDTCDWPVQIMVDNEEDSEKMDNLLINLNKALQSYRNMAKKRPLKASK